MSKKNIQNKGKIINSLFGQKKKPVFSLGCLGHIHSFM